MFSNTVYNIKLIQHQNENSLATIVAVALCVGVCVWFTALLSLHDLPREQPWLTAWLVLVCGGSAVWNSLVHLSVPTHRAFQLLVSV